MCNQDNHMCCACCDLCVAVGPAGAVPDSGACERGQGRAAAQVSGAALLLLLLILFLCLVLPGLSLERSLLGG